MIGFYNYTVVLTYLGVAAGIVGVCQAAAGNVRTAVVCLMLAGGCDLFDGTIARTRARSEQEQRFGIQIDSLSDLVCFGVLPAAIGYALGLNRWFSLLLCAYVLAALVRLAYYNVTEDELQIGAGQARKFYDGLPVTTAALSFPLVFALRPLAGSALPYLYAGMMLLVACAYVARVRIKKLGMGGMLIAALMGVAVLLSIVLVK